jgi:hypothetical protein
LHLLLSLLGLLLLLMLLLLLLLGPAVQHVCQAVINGCMKDSRRQGFTDFHLIQATAHAV